MAFLFKSKKTAPPPSSLPQATRNVHTSEGTTSSTTSSTALNGGLERAPDRSMQSPPPVASLNNSVNSLSGNPTGPPPTQFQRRERSESDAGASGARPSISGTAVPNAALYPWSQRRLNFPTPQSNPFPRYGAAVNAVASKDGEIYMMGGLINSSIVRGDLWMVESGGGALSCYPIATVSEGPGPRVGHASLLVGNAFIVFGGDTKMDDSDLLDDTLYLLNTSSRQWSRAAPPGPRPAGRYGHTLNILGSKIYIFGGQVEGYFFNDLIAFDLNALQSNTNQWEFLVNNTVEGEPGHANVPPARTNHSVVSFNDQLFLFGGTNGTQWFNDVWTYDPRSNAWTQQDCIGYIPAPREGHAAALVNDVMYVFGGRTEEGTDLGDLAAFRISSRRWYTFQNMGPSPSPRSGHSMTSYGRQIIVLAGEPSSSERDPTELSLVYVLDTAKIRYPNESHTTQQAGRADQPGSPVSRRPSNDIRNVGPTARSMSRSAEAQPPYGNSISRNGSVVPSGPGALVNRSEDGVAPLTSRLPRASMQAPAGPPPQGQAPTPRTNGVVSPQSRMKLPGPPTDARGFGIDTPKTAPLENHVQPTHTREHSKDNTRSTRSRETSPGGQVHRTPSHQAASKAKLMEAGEAAPLVMSSGGPSRQRSLRSQRAHSSMDGSDEGALARSGSGKHYSDGTTDARSVRSTGEEPRSPKLTAHQEALIKDLEAAKSRNAWYASELALARKAGYHSTSSGSPTFDERAVSQFSDEDRPLIEAFMNMRAELVKMQQTVEQQTSSTAKKVAEIEHQRDAAISEAAYARAKLAAHGGSQHSTPQPDSSRDLDEHSDRQTDISRRLALALAAQAEHKSKMDALTNELASERRARELAEESSEAAQQRLDDLSHSRNPIELEAIRTQLHEAQIAVRNEASKRADAENQLRMLHVDNEDLSKKHGDTSTRLKDHVSTMAALEAAVAASTSKAALFERQLEEERQQREATEVKLTQLRTEHEDRTRELDNTTKRLRDAEELAESHSKEASTHREALMAGLARISSPDGSSKHDSIAEQRLAALHQSTENAQALAKSHQEAADVVAQKLRAAEERIAGLEAYQEQSSREGLQIRKQLQTALRDVQTHQAENRELKARLESQNRETNALTVQHGALKDLLGERGINISDSRRSPMMDNSPGSRFGTPENSRVRELEHQLQSSMKAHEDTRQTFEAREQESERAYREKLEQLDTDYQSAVHYVKGTERVLKKMKEELARYKSQNTQLKSEVAATKERSASAEDMGSSEWHTERDELQKSIESIRSQTSSQISTLEMRMTSVQMELAATQAERDLHKSSNQELSRSTEQAARELTQLKSENSRLESRAMDAEHKVSMLLDQVGQSVGNYRRQSQMAPQPHGESNGIIHAVNHNRDQSISTMTDASQEDEPYLDNRGSLALDNFASELESLRSKWESNANHSHRISGEYEVERTPTREAGTGTDLNHSLATLRRQLNEDENSSTELPTNSKGTVIKEEPTT